jgi:hypothetical protein
MIPCNSIIECLFPTYQHTICDINYSRIIYRLIYTRRIHSLDRKILHLTKGLQSRSSIGITVIPDVPGLFLQQYSVIHEQSPLITQLHRVIPRGFPEKKQHKIHRR